MKPIRKALISIWAILLYSLAAAQPINPEIDSLINFITVESYSSHFDSLRTNEFCNRKVIADKKQSPDHDACRDYILRSFQQYFGDKNAYLHNFEAQNCKGLANVIGVKLGTDRNAGIWVISAHYDTNNNNETSTNNPIYSPGANDNGTGLAAILELARIIGKQQTKATILFAAWDFEEVFTDGYPTGSNEWFSSHVKKNKNTNWDGLASNGIINMEEFRGNINFDMFGNPQLVYEAKPVLWACYAKNSHIDFVESYAKTINRYIPEIHARTYGRLILSDHYTFASKKIPAVENLESNYITDPYYHSYSDNKTNPDNIDFEFATNVTRGGLAFLLEQFLPYNSPELIVKEANTLSIAELPGFYSFSIEQIPQVVNIYNQFGKLQTSKTRKESLSFSPPETGWYYLEIIGEQQFSKKILFLNKKEGLF